MIQVPDQEVRVLVKKNLITTMTPLPVNIDGNAILKWWKAQSTVLHCQNLSETIILFPHQVLPQKESFQLQGNVFLQK